MDVRRLTTGTKPPNQTMALCLKDHLAGDHREGCGSLEHLGRLAIKEIAVEHADICLFAARERADAVLGMQTARKLIHIGSMTSITSVRCTFSVFCEMI